MTSFIDMVPLGQGSIASLMPPEPAGISGYTVADQGGSSPPTGKRFCQDLNYKTDP